MSAVVSPQLAKVPVRTEITWGLQDYSRVTEKPHVTLVSVGCCSRARVCLDRRSETQIFVDPAAFPGTRHETEFFVR